MPNLRLAGNRNRVTDGVEFGRRTGSMCVDRGEDTGWDRKDLISYGVLAAEVLHGMTRRGCAAGEYVQGRLQNRCFRSGGAQLQPNPSCLLSAILGLVSIWAAEEGAEIRLPGVMTLLCPLQEDITARSRRRARFANVVLSCGMVHNV